MSNANLTFDDGEPLDIAKFNAMYSLILDAKSDTAAATSLYNNAVKKIPQVFARATEKVTVNNTKLSVIKISYAEMGLEATAKPSVSVTARGTSDNIRYVRFFTRNTGSSSAEIHAVVDSKDVKEVDLYFDYIVVQMKTVS